MTAAAKTYVIIFRQGPYNFSDDDKKRRTELTGAWAREHNANGHKLNPHILTLETARLGAALPDDATNWPITALLMIEARDMSEATRVASTHPAVGYNANVEIREWMTPAAIAAQN